MKRNYMKNAFHQEVTADDNPEMQNLLEKTRQVSLAMQGRRDGGRPDYNKLARILCEFSTANVYVLDH